MVVVSWLETREKYSVTDAITQPISFETRSIDSMLRHEMSKMNRKFIKYIPIASIFQYCFNKLIFSIHSLNTCSFPLIARQPTLVSPCWSDLGRVCSKTFTNRIQSPIFNVVQTLGRAFLFEAWRQNHNNKLLKKTE